MAICHKDHHSDGEKSDSIKASIGKWKAKPTHTRQQRKRIQVPKLGSQKWQLRPKSTTRPQTISSLGVANPVLSWDKAIRKQQSNKK